MTKAGATLQGCGALVIWSTAALCSVQLRSVPLWLLVALVCSCGFFSALYRHVQHLRDTTISPFLLFCGTLVILLNQAGYLLAFKLAPPARVDLIYYLWPILVILLRGVLPSQTFSIRALLASLCGFTGIYLVLGAESSSTLLNDNYSIGYLAAFGAALSWAAYTLFAGYKTKTHSGMLGLCCGPAALIAWMMHFTLETPYSPSGKEWLLSAFFGLGVMGVSLKLWDQGIKKGHFTLLNTLSYAVPVSSITLLIVTGQTHPSPILWLAALLVSLGPLFLKIKPRNIKSSAHSVVD